MQPVKYLERNVARKRRGWVTKDVLDLPDERRDFKKKRYKAEGAKEYREACRRIQEVVEKTKEG